LCEGACGVCGSGPRVPVALFFPAMNKALGNYSFVPFAAILALSLVFIFKFVPETKVGDVAQGLRSHAPLGFLGAPLCNPPFTLSRTPVL
jgi:hypothetical protein